MDKRKAQNFSDKVVTILKEERIQQKISQYRMANDIGMSKSSILYIENLKQRPSFYTIVMMASYLKLDLSKIIKRINKQ